MDAINKNLSPQHILEAVESDMWRMLQQLIEAGTEFDDDLVRQLDGRMQGYLFLQDHVDNREARIAFARSPQHMVYLRDAAGSRNVWMTDDEFAELVQLDDAVTLACFARSEQMKPHHLAYIEYKLGLSPHGNDLLATSWDTKITLKKSLENQGVSAEYELMKQAIESASGADARNAWAGFQLLMSSLRPVRPSGQGARTLH